MRLCVIVVLALGGCGLLDNGPEGSDIPQFPDAGCPMPGTHAEILSPLDGATNVQQPVPIQMHVVIPNGHDLDGSTLLDASGAAVESGHLDSTCSVLQPGNQIGPKDVTWTACYKDLLPNASYTMRIWVTCYDSTGSHELVTSTFRTAP
jgi:hypothetical protein